MHPWLESFELIGTQLSEKYKENFVSKALCREVSIEEPSLETSKFSLYSSFSCSCSVKISEAGHHLFKPTSILHFFSFYLSG